MLKGLDPRVQPLTRPRIDSPMSNHILVVWNCGAGGAERCAAVRSQIEATPAAELFEFTDPDSAAGRIDRALAEGCRRMVAAGGDGTVSTVASLLAERGASDVEFAVLPLGTGNDLARSLGMPLDQELAWEACVAGRAAPLDLLQVEIGGRSTYAANMVTAGNTGKYAAAITSDMKQRWGPFCYLRGTIDVLQELDVYEVLVQLDGEQQSRRYSALNVFVANGRTSGGGLTVAPESELDDGLLDVVLIQDGDAFDLAGLTADYLLSDFRNNDLVVHHRCREIRIAAQPAMPISIDGDPQEPGTVTVRVLPGALNAVRGGAALPGP